MTDKTQRMTLPIMPGDSAQLWKLYNSAVNTIDSKVVLLDSGFEVTDIQVLTGRFAVWEDANQVGWFAWAQDVNFVTEPSGFIVLDVDLTSEGDGVQQEEIISVYGMGENPNYPGTKQVGMLFLRADYLPYIGSDYTGSIQLQQVYFPYDPDITDTFHWPLNDGSAGAYLTTDSNGSLYWTDPPVPPNTITDVDNSLVVITPQLTWIPVPVTVTATQSSLPAHVSLEITFFTSNNNQDVSTRMLVNGSQTGHVYDEGLPTGVNHTRQYTWNPVLPLGTEVITIEVRHSGNHLASVVGNEEPTVLQMLEPGGVQAARAQSTSYVITREEFKSRLQASERENFTKLLLKTAWKPGPPPSWADVTRAGDIRDYVMGDSVNLLDIEVITEINWLESIGVLEQGRAAVILAT